MLMRYEDLLEKKRQITNFTITREIQRVRFWINLFWKYFNLFLFNSIFEIQITIIGLQRKWKTRNALMHN